MFSLVMFHSIVFWLIAQALTIIYIWNDVKNLSIFNNLQSYCSPHQLCDSKSVIIQIIISPKQEQMSRCLYIKACHELQIYGKNKCRCKNIHILDQNIKRF